jgi:hypothetical protein
MGWVIKSASIVRLDREPVPVFETFSFVSRKHAAIDRFLYLQVEEKARTGTSRRSGECDGRNVNPFVCVMLIELYFMLYEDTLFAYVTPFVVAVLYPYHGSGHSAN